MWQGCALCWTLYQSLDLSSSLSVHVVPQHAGTNRHTCNVPQACTSICSLLPLRNCTRFDVGDFLHTNAVFDMFDYTFSENGLMAHKGSELLAVQSLKTHLGEEKLKPFINFVLHYIADLDIPVKRGTFLEFRAGMMNISPIGAQLQSRGARRI